MEAGTGVDTDTASVGKRTRDASSPVDDDGEEGEDGYYDLVRKAKKQRKEEKKAEYESAKAAERLVFKFADTRHTYNLLCLLLALTPMKMQPLDHAR